MRIKRVLTIIICALGLLGCDHKESANTISVGTIDGPETQLMEVAAKVAWQRYRLRVKIVTFSDYNTPNIALADGSIDVNAFQHLPYLKKQMSERKYPFAVVGKTFLFPMGAYSTKIKKLYELRKGATIAIPSDPTNERRALLLLQRHHILKLRNAKDLNTTVADIVYNPLDLHFDELDAASLPRALADVDMAVINSTYVTLAGLSYQDAIIHEDKHSDYVNLFVVQLKNKNNLKVKRLVAAYNSKPVLTEAKRLFGIAAIPGWSKTY